MNTDLKSKIDHCYTLAKNGATELAQASLSFYPKQFWAEPFKSSLGNPESVFKSIERTSHRIGIDVSLQYATHFYQEGDKSSAHGWLRYARMHARQLKLNITDNISEIKDKYKDNTPILF